MSQTAHVPSSQRGLSLIELMIAVTLSAFLILGMVQIFGTTRAVYQTTSGLSRVQENGRFAMDFMRRDMRLAGQWGCFNEYTPLHLFYNHFGNETLEVNAPWVFRTDLSVEVFDYENTRTGGSVTMAATPTPPGAGNKWSPTLPATIAGSTATGAFPNSDVLVIRFADPDAVMLAGRGTNLAAGQLAISLANQDYVKRYATYVVTDCKQISLLQASTAPVSGDMPPLDTVPEAIFTATANVGLNKYRTASGTPAEQAWAENYFAVGPGGVGEGSPIARYQFVAYYVAKGANGKSSLFRRMLKADPGAALVAPYLDAEEELIEGVDSMQVTLGVAPTSASIDGYQGASAATYMDADTLAGSFTANTDAGYVNAWRRVKTVRVALLMRSPDLGAVNTGGEKYQVGDVTITAPANDTSVREVYETNVALRNRY